MKYNTMYVQITKIKDENVWYKKKKGHVFEVLENEEHPKMYYLTPKALKSLKKARHLEIGIFKEDCEIVDDGTREPFTIVEKPKNTHIDKLLNEINTAIRFHKTRGTLKDE